MQDYLCSVWSCCCSCLKINKDFLTTEGKTSQNQSEYFMKEEHESRVGGLEFSPSYAKDYSMGSTNDSFIRVVEQQGQTLLNQQVNIHHTIKQDHPYQDLLSKKLEFLHLLFAEELTTDPDTPETPYDLKISIRPSQDGRTNIYLYRFHFPTTYEFYESLQNDLTLQKKFDINIAKYECRTNIDEQTKVIYLAYKKALIVSPRDFIFVRYTFQQGEKTFWTITTSIPNEKTNRQAVRGNIILTATRVKQRDGFIDISVHSHVDMKMPIKQNAARLKGITEIKRYLDKCYEYILRSDNKGL